MNGEWLEGSLRFAYEGVEIQKWVQSEFALYPFSFH